MLQAAPTKQRRISKNEDLQESFRSKFCRECVIGVSESNIDDGSLPDQSARRAGTARQAGLEGFKIFGTSDPEFRVAHFSPVSLVALLLNRDGH